MKTEWCVPRSLLRFSVMFGYVEHDKTVTLPCQPCTRPSATQRHPWPSPAILPALNTRTLVNTLSEICWASPLLNIEWQAVFYRLDITVERLKYIEVSIASRLVNKDLRLCFSSTKKKIVWIYEGQEFIDLKLACRFIKKDRLQYLLTEM